LNRGIYSIPEEAKNDILAWRHDGMGWTAIARSLDDIYGISVHRSTIQRWYADHGEDYEVLSTQTSLVDSDEDDIFLDAKVKLDKKIATVEADMKMYRKLYKKALANVGNAELVLEAIKEFTPALAPQIKKQQKNRPQARQPKNFGKKPQVMVAPLTDTHVGDNVKKEQTLGLNEYDLDLFSRRIWGWSNQVLSLAEYRRNMCELDELVVPMLGDMISGDIHDELARTNIDNCMMQMIIGAYVISQSMAFLAPHFSKVSIKGVVGNHGRMTRKIPSKDRYMDWDYMLYQWIGVFLRDHDNIDIEIPKSFSHVFDVAGRKILIMHGDSIAGGGSQTSIKRAVSNLREVMQYNSVVVTDESFGAAEYFDDVLIGHFHRVDEMDIGTGSLHICGTTKGGDEFVISRLHLVTKPKHIVLYYHPVHGQVGKETVYLDKYDEEESGFDTQVPAEWAKILPN
jgi:predicted phosphodiesterase